MAMGRRSVKSRLPKLGKRGAVSPYTAVIIAFIFFLFAVFSIWVYGFEARMFAADLYRMDILYNQMSERLVATYDGENLRIKNMSWTHPNGTVTSRVMYLIIYDLENYKRGETPWPGPAAFYSFDPPLVIYNRDEKVVKIPKENLNGGKFTALDIWTAYARRFVVAINIPPPPPPPPPNFDFSVSLSPNSGSTPQGGSVSSTVTVTLVSGTTDAVYLSADNLPQGVSATFNPDVGNPTFTSSLTVATSTSTPTGTYQIRIIGNCRGLVRENTYTLTVTSAGGGGGGGGTYYNLTTSFDPTSEAGSVSPVGGSYPAGSQITLRADRNPYASLYWSFRNWSGNITSTENPVTITMDGNKSVTAVFKAINGSVSLISNGNGDGGMSPGETWTYRVTITSYNYNGPIVFSANYPDAYVNVKFSTANTDILSGGSVSTDMSVTLRSADADVFFVTVYANEKFQNDVFWGKVIGPITVYR